MSIQRFISVCLLLIPAAAAVAGTLGIGAWTAEDYEYMVPIVLRSDSDEVAALDFRLRYDPAVFEPIAAEPGVAALQANKMVTANVPVPGEFIVVMMGLNQTTVPSGEVARLALRRIGTPASGASELSVGDPTLATWEGIELPVQGASATIRFEARDTEGEEEDMDPAPEGEEKTPETASSSDARAGLEQSQSALETARARLAGDAPLPPPMPREKMTHKTVINEKASPVSTKKSLAKAREDALRFRDGIDEQRESVAITSGTAEGIPEEDRAGKPPKATDTQERHDEIPATTVAGALTVESDRGKGSEAEGHTNASEGGETAPRRPWLTVGIAGGVAVFVIAGLAGLMPLRRKLFR